MLSAISSIGANFSSRVISVSKMFIATLRVAAALPACWSRLGTRASSAKVKLPPFCGQVNRSCAAAGSANVNAVAAYRVKRVIALSSWVAAVPPVRQRVGMDDPLDRVVAHARQVRALDLAVDAAQPGDTVLDRREREVGAEEDLVAIGDRVFLGGNQDVVVLPGPVVE